MSQSIALEAPGGHNAQGELRTWRRAVLHDFHVIHAPHAGRAALQRLRHGCVEPFLFKVSAQPQSDSGCNERLACWGVQPLSVARARGSEFGSPPTWPSIVAPLRRTRTTRASPADNEQR